MKIAVLITALLFAVSAPGQTLFTYGTESATAADFLRAFHKNNPAPAGAKSKTIKDYLGLYIKSRLRVKEAYARRYDTLPHLQTELANLRAQIINNYLNDAATVDRMMKEVFERSLKDIRVSHIFISHKDSHGHLHEGESEKKRDAVLARLKAGEDFAALTTELSDDPAAKINKGDLGFITVFSLPYAFENAVYATAPGNYSLPVRSKNGFHIFKHTGERKAAGKIKAQQILLAFPPDAGDAEKKILAARADSVYKRILAGDDFSELARKLSNDYISAAAGGTLQEIGVGQYDAVFENALWALPKNGAVSKPFLTSHGWHILKRISVRPVVTDPGDKKNQDELKQRLMMDPRWRMPGDFMLTRIKEKGLYKDYQPNTAVLRAYTDSLLDGKPIGIGQTMQESTPLFSLGATTYHAGHWINYARTFRYKQDGTGLKTFEELWNDYEKYTVNNYYRDHLELFNEDFRYQMTEFMDGNVFFEIMQEEVWNKAQADSAALKALYEKNKQRYTWKASADAVIFFCTDQGTAKAVYDQLKKNPAAWRTVADRYSETVVADSSRYEWSSIPNLNKAIPRPGMVTTPLTGNDNSISFACILKTYPQAGQRSYAEARGLVINDYQATLEQQWDAALRKKYPVVIDEKVLAEISK